MRGPEILPYFWNPNLFGIQSAPESFMERVRKIGDDLRVVFNPVNGRWQVFCEDPKIHHKFVHGWRLLFIHNDPKGEHLPLDERLLARLYSVSARHQNVSGKQYFDRIMAEMARDKERQERKWQQDTIDAAMPSYDHAQISVSGFGKSNGSKFADYLS